MKKELSRRMERTVRRREKERRERKKRRRLCKGD
jgi:hypothetical protein